MEITILAFLTIAFNFIPFDSIYMIIGLSFTLQLSIRTVVKNDKYKKLFTNFNLLILTSSLLLILLSIKSSTVNKILLYGLSIQFLLITLQSLRSKSRNCFYIIPLTVLSFIISFDFYNKIPLLFILLGITITNLLDFKGLKKDLKQEIYKKEFENNIILNLSNNVQKQISKGDKFINIAPNILNSALMHIGADSGAIVENRDSGFKIVSKTKNYIEVNLEKIGFKPVIVKNTEITKNKRFQKYSNDRANYISSIIIQPLSTANRNYGYLILQNNSFLKYFSGKHLSMSHIYINFIQSTLENIDNNKNLIEKKELDKEVEIASGIQQSLIPKEIGKTNLSVAVINKPSKGMSGDYYNILPLNDGKTLITICDVAGKGIPAAMVTVIINTTMKLLANKIKKASTLLSFINNTLCENVDIERYATMSCIIIDPESMSLSYSNAGHHPTLIKRANKVLELNGIGLPTGIQKNGKYQEVNFSYQKDDILLLYTDGVSESMSHNGDQFGKEGIKKNLLSHKVNSPTHIVANLLQESEGFSYQDFKFDDRTIIGVSL